MLKHIRTYEGNGRIENGEPVFYTLREYQDFVDGGMPPGVKEIRGFIRPTSDSLPPPLGDMPMLQLSDRRKIKLIILSSDDRSATVLASDGFFY
jgi:hypothetical protein